ncbi:MAG TPA: nicotinate-nucleotide adenylyltransferase [bacterium]|nr:nicotinate-nucleotide adenylyltransferase [bacterium]
MTSRRIGLLGGTFNPPHLGHLVLADWAKDELALDAVWLLPNAAPPHRYAKEQPRGVTPEQRWAMVQAAVADSDGLAGCDLELRRTGPSYTVDTLHELHVRYPHYSWHFLLGMDAAKELPTWEGFARLCELCAFVVARRPGEPAQPPAIPPARIMLLDMPLLDISSTLIRRRAATGRSIRQLVPRAVAEYIAAQGLYRDGAA